MSDLSKLSDAEIAERACRRLGWREEFPLHVWLVELFKDSATFIIGGLRNAFTNEDALRELCFGFPGPIMEKKVKEWLKGKKKDVISGFVDDRGMAQVGPIKSFKLDADVNAHSESRALYEAFLMVDEEVAND